MAGDWIKMRIDLHEDPNVLWMAQELGVRPETVVGYCHRFWGLVSRQTRDGCLIGPSLLSLGNSIGLPGFPELLVACGWLEHDNSGKKPVTNVPKFERHLSQSAKERALASERKKVERVSKTSRPDRDKSVTREEKRREEKKKNKKKNPPTPRGGEIVSGGSSHDSPNHKGPEKPQDAPGATIAKDPTKDTFPANLRTAAFLEAWEAWTANRRENGKKAYKPRGARGQLTRISKWGPDRAIAAIEFSIAQNYDGIVEDPTNARNQNQSRRSPGLLEPRPGQYDELERQARERAQPSSGNEHTEAEEQGEPAARRDDPQDPTRP